MEALPSLDLLLTLDYIGTLVFSISGTLTAIHKRLDIFGAIFIGFVTAIGGGTVRDMMMGEFPVSWIRSVNYFYIILLGVFITIIFKKTVSKLRNTLFLFDTIGIGVFTVLGMEKALAAGISEPFAIIMGLCSAVVGGIIRDTLTNEVPLIFHREIYATACIVGALIYLALHNTNIAQSINEGITVLTIIGIRIIAVRYKLTMPRISMNNEE